MPDLDPLTILRAVRAGAEIDEEEQEAISAWWSSIPDFLKPDYSFDVPPHRMPLACYALTFAGAPRHCPQSACRRARRCRGGDGPPCFRADRKPLQHALLLIWLSAFHGLRDAEYEDALDAADSRYCCAPPASKGAKPAARIRPRR